MAKSKQDVSVTRVVSTAVQTALQRYAMRGPIEEVRALRAIVGRLERRVERLAADLDGKKRKSGPGRPGRPPLHDCCTVKACTEHHYALGLCSKHYQQRRRSKRMRRSTR